MARFSRNGGAMKIEFETDVDVNGGLTHTGNPITSTNKIVAQNFELSSDRRIKSEIQSLKGTEFRNLRPSSFYKKDEFGYGFIAQEIYEHYPSLVSTGES